MTSDDERDPKAWVLPQREFIRAVLQIAPEAEKSAREIYAMPEGPAKEEAYRHWGDPWHLTAPWCRRVVIELLFDLVRQYWEDLTSRRWFRFECAGWHPDRPKTSEEEICAAFKAALQEHKTTREEEFRRDGWIDPGDHYEREHYLWAARYVINKDDTFEKIAMDTGKSREGVRVPVREVLRSVELPVRNKKPGPHS